MHKLREWRDAKTPKMTLAEAGAGVGCSAVQWFRLESGERQITVEMAGKIEAFTGIPRHELRPDVWDAPAQEASAA